MAFRSGECRVVLMQAILQVLQEVCKREELPGRRVVVEKHSLQLTVDGFF
jgi:hypothetical protein